MQVNNKAVQAPAATSAPAASRPVAQAMKATAAARMPGDNFNFKAGDANADQQLADFVNAHKADTPGIQQAASNLAPNLEAGAILFVLSAAVGAGAREIIMALTNKDNAFVEAKAMSPDPLERKLIAQSYKIGVGTAMRLASDPDLSVRYALAVRMKNNPHQFDSAVLEIMARDPNPIIRGLVASSDKLSKDTVKKLAGSDSEASPYVRAAAIANKNLDKNDKNFYKQLDDAKGGIYSTMMDVLTAPDTDSNNKTKIGFLRSNPYLGLPHDIMDQLAKSQDPGVREALARRPDLPDDIIRNMYERHDYTFGQKFKKFFGMDPGEPAGTAHLEGNRIVLMSLAENPNASVAMLTELVKNAKKYDSSNNFTSSIDASIDSRLGITASTADPGQYNTDIVARSIVGNPRTDATVRQLANAAAYPFRYNEDTAFKGYLATNNANDLYLKGKYADAADAYKKVIGSTFHDSEQAYFELGQCEMALNDVGSARLAFMQALNINNNYTAAAVALDAINHPSGGR